MHAIVKQIAEQLKGHIPVSDEKGYASLYPFDSSIDYYLNPSIAFTDPRDNKEHMLDYKDDEDRLAQLKKINTVITTYNKVADKNQKEFLSKVPSDGKVHTPEEFGFTKSTIPIGEHPLWAFTVMGRTKRGDGYDDVKLIIALLAVEGSGNETVKSPFVAVFVPPKSNTTHNLSP